MREGILPLFAVALAIAPSPTFAQGTNAYEAGVAARQAGHPREAHRLLVQWLAAHPDDADALLQLAYADLALGDLDAAQAGFERVLKQAPDYRDASEGLAAIAARRAADSDVSRATLVVEGALSDLSANAANWRELTIDGQAQANARTTLGARVSRYRRFGVADTEIVGRVGFHPSEDLWLRAFAGGTPNADFRPKAEVGAGADLRLTRTNATVLTFDAAYQRFPLQKVVVLNPGILQYLADGRAWLTLRGIGTIAGGGPLEIGGLVRGDFVPASGWRLYAGASIGPDTDLGIVTRVTGLFGGAEAPLGSHFGLTGSIARESRDAGLDRTEFRLGLKARF